MKRLRNAGLANVWIAAAMVAPWAVGARARAAVLTWASPTSGSFDSAAEWNPQQTPTSSDDVSFGVAGTYTVTLDERSAANSFAVTAGAVTFSTSDSLFAFPGSSQVSGGSLTIANSGFQPSIRGGLTITNATLTNNDLGTYTPFEIGSLTIGSGGLFRNAGNADSNGLYTVGSGGTAVNTGSVSDANSSSVGLLVQLGGTYRGTGDFSGRTMENDGTVRPGASGAATGTLSLGADGIDSGYTQGATGTLDIDVDGETPGSGYDRLVSGTTYNPFALAGTLDVDQAGGFTAGPTDTFTIISGADVTGTFDTVELPAGWGIRYDATDVVVGPGVAVPEPSSAGPIVAAGLGLIRGRRRRRDDVRARWVG